MNTGDHPRPRQRQGWRDWAADTGPVLFSALYAGVVTQMICGGTGAVALGRRAGQPATRHRIRWGGGGL